jgi:hypothetical protein
MNRKEITTALEYALRDSKKEQPQWPDHIAAQAGFVVMEAGDLMSKSLQFKYKDWEKGRIKFDNEDEHAKKQMEATAINVMVYAFRFLENLK